MDETEARQKLAEEWSVYCDETVEGGFGEVDGSYTFDDFFLFLCFAVEENAENAVVLLTLARMGEEGFEKWKAEQPSWDEEADEPF